MTPQVEIRRLFPNNVKNIHIIVRALYATVNEEMHYIRVIQHN